MYVFMSLYILVAEPIYRANKTTMAMVTFPVCAEFSAVPLVVVLSGCVVVESLMDTILVVTVWVGISACVKDDTKAGLRLYVFV